MSSIPPANKRSRTDTDNDKTTTTAAAATINSANKNDTNNNNLEDNDVITTSKILQQITALSNDYRNATPFPHGVINNFCTDGLLGEFVCCFYVAHHIETMLFIHPSNLQY
jgi:hypothetical protein